MEEGCWNGAVGKLRLAYVGYNETRKGCWLETKPIKCTYIDFKKKTCCLYLSNAKGLTYRFLAILNIYPVVLRKDFAIQNQA